MPIIVSPGFKTEKYTAMFACVVTSSRIAFGIFVCHHTAHGFQNRLAHHILRGDEFEFVLQPLGLKPYGLVYLVIKTL
jgi:hypothetical protein